jgi:hypothetical protein
VNIIYIKWLAALPAIVLAAGAASAQDFTAGKTPAQLFSSDCATCHHLPNGLGKKYDAGSLAAFLRAHYTTKPDNAGALAKYVMGFATLRAAPITPPSADEGGVGRPSEGTRRRTSNLSGDGEKPARSRAEANRADVNTSEAPRPPAGLTQPGPAAEAAALPPAAASRNARPARGRSAESESSPAKLNDAKLNDYARSGATVVTREAVDPIARIRAYAASGAGPLEAAAEAPKPASGRVHRRSDNGAQPVPAAAPAEPTAPAVSAAPAGPAVPAAPAAPADPNAMPPPAPL